MNAEGEGGSKSAKEAKVISRKDILEEVRAEAAEAAKEPGKL